MTRIYLDKAYAHVKTAKSCLADDDEQMLQIAAFHLHHAVEISLKQVLRECGIDYSKTHIISSLANKVPSWQTIISLDAVDAMAEKSYLLSEWEEMTRYEDSYIANRRLVEKMLPVVAAFVNDVNDGIAKADEKAKAAAEGNSRGVRKMDLK